MRAGRIVRVVAAMVCGGLVAAACSSGSPSTTSTTTSTTLHGSTTTTGVAPTTASTTTTTGVASCAQVTVTPGQTQGAAGTIIGTVTVAAAGTGTCTIMGYPNLTRYSSSGAVVPTTVVQGLTTHIAGPPSQPPALVTVSSSQKAAFTFQYSDVVTGSETSCAISSTVSVTTPGATTASSPVPLSISACNNGTVDVSPIYAATS
jgi:Protein of unknown function (DUF4232)